ncbi:hypothetical protein MICA_1590 [Micavibrio aeruginosavorus ARL-13]|uniref:Uncharacterized protein n=1 Tax=Micavibrio aeruginosavorus (strain ARL-13) TaxID=856793 RepID=G2KPT6_MICAA|nr:hypothetical protein MICA_1590 [Micavibrio aeruginosavorus ARL-13]
MFVIPAKAGIHTIRPMDSRFRGNDKGAFGSFRRDNSLCV